MALSFFFQPQLLLSTIAAYSHYPPARDVFPFTPHSDRGSAAFCNVRNSTEGWTFRVGNIPGVPRYDTRTLSRDSSSDVCPYRPHTQCMPCWKKGRPLPFSPFIHLLDSIFDWSVRRGLDGFSGFHSVLSFPQWEASRFPCSPYLPDCHGRV